MIDSVSDGTGRAQAPRTPGAILAAERERQGLARADIAQRLHMSVTQIEALEAADYARLPRGTFLRGFTRNYARSLGIDAEELVCLLAQDAPRENAPRIVVPSQNIRFDPLSHRLANPYVKAAGIATAVLMLGFAAMYWWLFVRPQWAVPVEKTTTIEEPKRALDAPAVKVPEVEATPAAALVEGPATSPAAMPAAADAAAPEPAEPPRAVASGEGVLRFAFRGAAWVEITDARGKVLLSRTHAGGSSAEVVGRPPFGLVIGNSREVSLTFNGRDIDLASHTRAAVARFTLP